MKDNIQELWAKPHADDDYIHAAHLMETGGNFAACIARAYYAADKHNRARLRAAFPDLFTKYFNAWLSRQNNP